MNTVVTCINFTKARGLNPRRFRQFLDDMDEDYEDLLYFSEVRWLSRGKMMKRFYELKEVSAFMTMKGKEIPELQDIEWLNDLMFLVDITIYLNELNAKLQNRDQLIPRIILSHKNILELTPTVAYPVT